MPVVRQEVRAGVQPPCACAHSSPSDRPRPRNRHWHGQRRRVGAEPACDALVLGRIAGAAIHAGSQPQRPAAGLSQADAAPRPGRWRRFRLNTRQGLALMYIHILLG